MYMQKQLLRKEAMVLKNRDRYMGVFREMKLIVEGSLFIFWPLRPK